jgi:hypothetical protein
MEGDGMSNRHPTIGGKGKPASTKPPRAKKPPVIVPVMVCDCGRRHHIHGNPTDMVLFLCDCGATIYYHPESGGATIETVDVE